jgi:hypothetical protein
VQEQSGSHSYTFVKGSIAEISGKTDSQITKGTVVWAGRDRTLLMKFEQVDRL